MCRLPAIEAGVAAISDTAFMDQALAHNTKWLAWLTDEISKLGIRVTPSVGNFLLLHFKDKKTAPMARCYLQDNGIVVRRMDGYGIPQRCACRLVRKKPTTRSSRR